MREKKLDEAGLREGMAGLPEWKQQGEAIVRTFEFGGYPEAVAFAGRTVEPAEAAGHHPDIDIRYNRVRVLLTTHDSGGLTAKDIAMAAALDGLF